MQFDADIPTLLRILPEPLSRYKEANHKRVFALFYSFLATQRNILLETPIPPGDTTQSMIEPMYCLYTRLKYIIAGICLGSFERWRKAAREAMLYDRKL